MDDPESVRALGRALVDGLNEWLRRVGGDPARVPEHMHAQVLKNIGLELTLDKVREIHLCEGIGQQKQLVTQLCRQVSRIIQRTLIPIASAPRRGRVSRLGRRDQQIYDMRQRGMSYGRIARQLQGIERLAVQAAYRRTERKLGSWQEMYRQLKRLLKPLGIILREQPAKHPSRHKPKA
jgi:hypothetical protein